MMEGLGGVALEKLTRQPCHKACLCGHPEEDTPDSPKFERLLSQISDKKASQRLHKTAQAPSRGMVGIRVYAMHEIYTVISTTRLCQAIAFSPCIYLISSAY